MDPNFWGHPTWVSLHSITFNYPVTPTSEDKTKMYNYFKQVSAVLPCSSCAKSFELYFNYIPITEYLDDVYGLTFWLYTMHFIVNKKLKKKNMNFSSVVKMYLAQKTNCVVNKNQCVKNTTPENPNKHLEFQSIATQKYSDKTQQYVAKLLKDYPTLSI